MGKWNRWGRTLSVVVLAAAVVCGCGVKETLLSGRKSEREYGKAETMVIVTTERLRGDDLELHSRRHCCPRSMIS